MRRRRICQLLSLQAYIHKVSEVNNRAENSNLELLDSEEIYQRYNVGLSHKTGIQVGNLTKYMWPRDPIRIRK